MKPVIRVMFVFVLLFAISFPVCAEEITLEDDQIINGQIERVGNYLLIELEDGGKKIVPFADVKNIKAEDTPQSKFRSDLAKLDPKDADGHYKLALWAKKNNMKPAHQTALAKTISIDPDHEKARNDLGHRKLDGKWVGEDVFMKAKAMAKYKGKWMLAEEKALLLLKDAEKKAEEIVNNAKKRADLIKKNGNTKDGRREKAKTIMEEVDRILAKNRKKRTTRYANKYHNLYNSPIRISSNNRSYSYEYYYGYMGYPVYSLSYSYPYSTYTTSHHYGSSYHRSYPYHSGGRYYNHHRHHNSGLRLGYSGNHFKIYGHCDY